MNQEVANLFGPQAQTQSFEQIKIYPNSHYVTPRPTLGQAAGKIKSELKARLTWFLDNGFLLEAERLETQEEGQVAGVEPAELRMPER